MTEQGDKTMGDLSLREIIRILGGSIREFKKDSIKAPLFVLGEVIIECSLPFITASLINELTAGADMAVIGRYGIILTILALASLACGSIAGISASVASTGFARNLRHDMFESIQRFSFSNIDRFSTNSLVTRLTTDTQNVQMAYLQIIRSAVRSPMMIIFAATMAFISGGAMAAIYVLVSVLLACGLIGIAVHVMPIFRRIFKKYDAMNESVEENISGIRVVKSYVREDYETEKFHKASGEIFKDFWGVERILAWNGPLMTFCIDVIYAFVIFFASKNIVSSAGEAMQVGQMSALITYGFSMLMSLMMFSMVFVMITMAEESSRRICEVLIEEPDLTNPEHPVMEVPDGSVDFDHVSFRYHADSDRTALSDIDLHIKSGEVIGVIGGTGSSKSTLIQLISRLYDATEGAVRVGGIDVRDYDMEVLRNEVAVVLQRNVLFSGTIKDNLRWGDPNATDEELVAACKLAQADEFVQQLPDKYDTYIEQGGTNVSGGQKQRLCIARALLKKPKILILDDSTSAVDTKTDQLIREGFRSFIPETTKIIIAQRTGSVEDADRIIVMDGGAISAIGTHAELLQTSEIYREVYLTQNKASHDDAMAEGGEVSAPIPASERPDVTVIGEGEQHLHAERGGTSHAFDSLHPVEGGEAAREMSAMRTSIQEGGNLNG